MKVLSIDVETGGLTPETSLIEIGMVYADLDDPGAETPCARIVFMHENLIITPYCCGLHTDLLNEIAKVHNAEWWMETVEEGYSYATVRAGEPEALSEHTTTYVTPEGGDKAMRQTLDLLEVDNWREQPVVIAGKSPVFDVGFLLANKCLEELRYHRRLMDPAILYAYPSDEVPPDLQTCLDRAAMTYTVSHTAVEDARVVVYLLRKGLMPSNLGIKTLT